MTAQKKKALLFGATGLIGGHLLHELLDSPVYCNVTAVVRRDTGIRHPKLTQLFSDLQSIKEIEERVSVNDVFCCIGTTRKKTPDLKDYYRIDHDYPVAAAKVAKATGAEAFVLVSAVGANAGSANFYLRIKGETERDAVAEGPARVYIFRPSLLTGDRTEKRWTETVSAGLFKLINPLLIKKLSKYRSIPATSVAKAMRRAAEQGARQGVYVYYWNDIIKLA